MKLSPVSSLAHELEVGELEVGYQGHYLDPLPCLRLCVHKKALQCEVLLGVPSNCFLAHACTHTPDVQDVTPAGPVLHSSDSNGVR